MLKPQQKIRLVCSAGVRGSVYVPISGNKSWEIFQEVFLLSRHSCSIKAPVCVSRLYRRAYFNELYPSLPDCCMLGLPFGVTSILIPSAQTNKPLLTSTGRPYATKPWLRSSSVLFKAFSRSMRGVWKEWTQINVPNQRNQVLIVLKEINLTEFFCFKKLAIL